MKTNRIFSIAEHYGFANYMFSTHEGPSFPGHQFLFSGTSSPVWPVSNDYFQCFVSENSGATEGNSSGCPNASGNYAPWIDPMGTEWTEGQLGQSSVGECYDRNTLVTYQNPNENNQIDDKIPSWTYYSQVRGSIWDAPENNPQICYGTVNNYTIGTPCGGNSEWSSHVRISNEVKTTESDAPILYDIANCNLPSIAWVTPDEAWSDHPDNEQVAIDLGYGPSWVADIIDAIGKSGSLYGCDYWATYPTAIFVVWDDWGGFYDHVPPPVVYTSTTDASCTENSPNYWGCGYVYGFRVPLLVVSEYTPTHYVSGPVPDQYPPMQEYTHDFGSILSFIESNFSLTPIAPQPQQNGYNGQPITYADQNSLDYNWCQKNGGCVPLSDFFTLAQQGQQPRGFTYISPQSSNLGPCYFECYSLQGGSYFNMCSCASSNATPMGPDEGTDDDD
jgi:phospholipase C